MSARGVAAKHRCQRVGGEAEGDPAGVEPRAPGRAVLARVADTALRVHRDERGARRRGALAVARHGSRLVVARPARRAETQADVRVLAVEEEALVPAADLLQ